MVERIVDLSDLEFDDYALNDSRKGKIMKAYLKGTIGIGPALTLKTCFRIFRKEGSLPEEQSIYGFGTKSAEDKFRRDLQNKVGRILDIIERNAGKTRRRVRPRTIERKKLEGVVEDVFTREELEKLGFKTIYPDEFDEDNKYHIGEDRGEEEEKSASFILPDPEHLKRVPKEQGPEGLDEFYGQWAKPRQVKVPSQGTSVDPTVREEPEEKDPDAGTHPVDEKEDPEITEATEQRRRERDEKFSDEARRIEEARRQEEKGEREPHERKKPKHSINEEGEFEDERKQTGIPNKKVPRAAKEPKKKPDKKPKYKKPTLKAGAKFNLKDPVKQVKQGKTSLYGLIRKERERVRGK